MSATVRQRRTLHLVAQHPSVRAYQRVQRMHYEGQVARLRSEQDVQPEPVNFCAVPTPGEDGEPQVMAWVGSVPSILIIAAACVAWAAYFWSAV
jgi:hypothetical protein